MALGPRLDLRQSQTLVMTPQLRQAIQLLQYSNIEVTTFVERRMAFHRIPLTSRRRDKFKGMIGVFETLAGGVANL